MENNKPSLSGLKREDFQKEINGKATDLFFLTNENGMEVAITNYGGALVAIMVPDRDGNYANVIQGHDNIDDCVSSPEPFLSTLVGRYGNRICHGKFTLNGKQYNLAINNGPNHLHGGPTNYSRRLWLSEPDAEGVTFVMRSPDGDENYPGNLEARVRYTFTAENELCIELSATTDALTVVNLTNHAYWNLSGIGAGTALNHELKLHADKWLPTDQTLIPTGELLPVAGTPMDFTQSKPLGRDLEADFPALKYGKGYDNCWAVDGWKPGTLCRVAELFDSVSGRLMTVESDQPGVQVYTGNWLGHGELSNKAGGRYADYDGVASECQDFPDSPNKPHFPSTELRPGEEYHRKIRFRFSVQ